MFLFLLALIVLSATQLLTYNLYAKEKVNKDAPGTAIFVMAIPSEVRVESKMIQSKNEEINIDIKYPKLEGLQDKKFEKIINNYLKNNSIQSKKELTKEAKLYNEQVKETDFPDRCYELIQNFTVKDTINGYFVLELFEYNYRGGAHGVTTQKYIVIDLVSNKIVMLKDLFDKDGNYIDEINKVIKKQISEISRQGNYFFQGTEAFTTVSDQTQFYINPEGNLMIVFNLYEIAPYSSGIYTFNLPKQDLSSYVLNV